jgi:uncharacterized protein YbjT (DUF2867 family)
MVYLSVIHADRFVNVPHFAVKFGAERMIEQMGFSATILRPAYFIDNDLTIKDVPSSTTASIRCRSAARAWPWSTPATSPRSRRSN